MAFQSQGTTTEKALFFVPNFRICGSIRASEYSTDGPNRGNTQQNQTGEGHSGAPGTSLAKMAVVLGPGPAGFRETVDQTYCSKGPFSTRTQHGYN
ncbi:UNVERIFIED_CONTAM: hypothetical protein K2H54_013568 [Gekko kuhli]